MRFVITVKAAAAREAGDAGTWPDDGTVGQALDRFHDELARAGVLLDASGVRTSHTLIEVRSRDEALEWARRLPIAGEIEIRPVGDDDDFEPGGLRHRA